MANELSTTPWAIQSLEIDRHGYEDWQTYAIRDAQNHCIAVVGEIDRATTPHNAANATLMTAAPELLAACRAMIAALQNPIQCAPPPATPENFARIEAMNLAGNMMRAAIAKATGATNNR